MSKVFWKGSTLLAPVSPTMVSCGTMENPNIITVAWTGIINSNPPMTYVSVRPTRHSHSLISEGGSFVINLTPSKLIRLADICGVKSGRDGNKFTLTGLTPCPSSQIESPLIGECPVNIECKVKSITSLGSHDMFIADIVGVHVDEEFMDLDGKLHMDRCGLAAYVHGEYFSLGKKIGSFGYSVRKRPKHKPGAASTKSKRK